MSHTCLRPKALVWESPTITVSLRLVVSRFTSFQSLVALAIALRLLAAVATPLGADFVILVRGAAANDPSTTSGPIGWLTWIAVNAWAALPISHPSIIKAFTSTSFQWSAELLLLILLAKLPLVLLDILSALLVYKIVVVLQGTTKTAEKASLLWLLNPYVIFAIEMWGSPEILPISLTLLAAWATIRGNGLSSSLALAVATASKLFPGIFYIGSVKEHLASHARRRLVIELLFALLGVGAYLLWSSQAVSGPAPGVAEYNPQTFAFDEFTISTPTASIGLGTIAVAITWLVVLQFWHWNAKSIIPASFAAALAFLAFYNWSPAALLWPMAFLALLIENVGLRTRGFLLLLAGALFALVSNQGSIFTATTVFFVPAATSSSVAIQLFKQLSTSEVTQVLILPVLRALFAALALVLAGSLHAQNGATMKRFATDFWLELRR